MPKSKKYKQIINSNKPSFLSKLPKTWLIIGVVMLVVFAWIGIVQISNYLERRDLNHKYSAMQHIGVKIAKSNNAASLTDLKFCSVTNMKFKKGVDYCVVGQRLQFTATDEETATDTELRIIKGIENETGNPGVVGDQVYGYEWTQSLADYAGDGCSAVISSNEQNSFILTVEFSCIKKTNSQYFH